MTDAAGNPFDEIGFEPGGENHEITVTRARRPAPVPPQPASAPATSPSPAASLPDAAAASQPSGASVQPPPEQAGAAPSTSSNPFDAIGFDDAPAPSNPQPKPIPGVLANQKDDSYLGGAAKNVGSTIVKGLSHAPGFVGDLGNFSDALMEIPEWVESKVTGQPFADVVKKRKAYAADAQAHQDAFQKGLFGFSVDPRHYLPSGSDVSNWLAQKGLGSYEPETTLGKYGSAAGEAVLGAFGPGGGSMLKGIATHALPNAAAGVGAQYVGDTTGDPLLASLAGIGASGVAGAAKGAPQRKAARILSDAADDPRGALAAISRGNPDAVPGVDPTTAELTRDPGLYRLQNDVNEQNPGALHGRREAQNRGRLEALDSLMPDGSQMDTVHAFNRHFDDISERTQAMVDTHHSIARDAAERLRGQGLPTNAYGTMLRGVLTDAESARSTAEGKLWDAVDPENRLTNDMAGIKDASSSVYGSMPAADREFMSPAETTFAKLIDGYRDVEPFRQVASLKSNLATAMRRELSENGSSPAYRRMSLLMRPIQETINGTVARRDAADKAAVARGEMAPEDTLDARIKRYARQHDAESRSASGPDAGSQPVAVGAGASSGISRFPGGEGQGNRRLGIAAGDQAIPGQVAGGATPAAGVTPSYYPGGVLGVRHELAEHGSLITSHDSDFRPRADFPQNLQPRARDSAGSREQVHGMAARLQPERLGPSPEANSGAPIVGPDHVVESGNGRTMAIGKAYDAGRGDAYRAHLERLGYDTSGFDKPVLVARRVTPMSPDEREFFSHAANGATALRMGSAEQAVADARHITPAMLDSQAGPNIVAAANRPFVNGFMAKLPAAERGALVDREGNLSQTGVRRIQAAMVANAYSDHGLLSKAFDDADPNVKGLVGALVDAFGPWAKMRAAASRGDISEAHDLTPELMSAVKLAIRSRDEGRPLGEILRQGDLFNSETSRLVSSMLSKDGERLASRPQIEASLRNYAEEATKNASGDRLFGDPASVGDVLKASAAKADRETGSATAAPVFADVPPAERANMDDAAAERIKAANTATREKHEIFGAKPIDDVLAEQGGRGNFKVPASVVPSKLFPKGPAGFEAVTAFRRAVGDDASAMRLLRDHAIDDLRREAFTDEGVFPEAAVEKWRKSHEDALRAYPELAKLFKDAGTATSTYQKAAVDRRDLIRQYERSAFGHLMNASHPEQVDAIVSSLTRNPRDLPVLRKLVDVASKDPTALAGLRRAYMDNTVSKYVSDIETTSGPQRTIRAKKFREDMIKARAANDIVLGKDATDLLNRLALSMPLASTSIESAGQAKHADLARYLKAAQRPHETLGERLFKIGFVARELGEGVGELFGTEHGGSVTAAVAGGGLIGKKLINAIRATGARKVGDLITDAVLNPERYKALASLAPVRPDVGSAQSLAFKLKRASMFAPDALAGVIHHAMTRSPRFNDRAQDEKRRAAASKASAPGRAAGGRVSGPDDEPVAHITGEEIAPRSASLEDLRAAARDHYERHLRGTKVFSQGLGRHVQFRGARKAFSASGNPDKLRMFAALKDIVGKGRHVESTAPKDPKAEEPTRAYHYLEAKVGTPDGHRRVGLTVREDTNGDLYYNHSMRDEEERSRPAATQDTASKAGPGSAGGETANPNIDLNADRSKRAAGGRVALAPFEPKPIPKWVREAADRNMRRRLGLEPEERAAGGRVGSNTPFGVPSYSQILAPAKRAMSRGLGFADGGRVDAVLHKHGPAIDAVERAMQIIRQDIRKAS